MALCFVVWVFGHIIYQNIILMAPRSISTMSPFKALIFFIIVVSGGCLAHKSSSVDTSPKVERSTFPKDFVFGTASAAYQYEGAAKEDGKGLSIWDVFTHNSGKIDGNTTGDVAADQYHRFKEDVWLMKDIGMDAYRFSFAWSRILPNGTGNINWEGVHYYKQFIDSLLDNGNVTAGIKPYVTLYHWDLPQALEDSIGGWLSPKIIDAYADFARLCFQLFGDKVKHWITFNEIHSFASAGYFSGEHAPGRCSPPNGNCTAGNSSTEPYIVAHHALNAHAACVEIYRNEFQTHQKGVIGITADSTWYEPLYDNVIDKAASNRAMEFSLGWFLDPIIFGDYPASMHNYVDSRLPKFTRQQSRAIKGSYDFIGFNHYASQYATVTNTSNTSDNHVTITPERDGIMIGPTTVSPWLYIWPPGMRKSLAWIRQRYDNPVLYITENGVDEGNTDGVLSLNKQLDDGHRISYYHDYLQQLLLAIHDGSDVRGYFAWSLLDNFEWAVGFTVRFGIYYIDYENDQARYPKESAHWFRKILKHQT